MHSRAIGKSIRNSPDNQESQENREDAENRASAQDIMLITILQMSAIITIRATTMTHSFITIQDITIIAIYIIITMMTTIAMIMRNDIVSGVMKIKDLLPPHAQLPHVLPILPLHQTGDREVLQTAGVPEEGKADFRCAILSGDSFLSMHNIKAEQHPLFLCNLYMLGKTLLTIFLSKKHSLLPDVFNNRPCDDQQRYP